MRRALLLALLLPAAAQARATVYLATAGGAYSPGPDDARTNVSSVLSQAVTLPPPACSPSWSLVAACLGRYLAPYDVTITLADPLAADHLEVVFTTVPTVAGLPAGVEEVSPFTCDAIPHGVAFVFADALGCGEQALCDAAARQVGHLAGADTLLDCADAMSVLDTCQTTGYRDAATPCGETAARACACPGAPATQNSYRTLLAAFGPRPDTHGGGCGSAGDGAGVGAVVAAALALALRRAQGERGRLQGERGRLQGERSRLSARRRAGSSRA